MSAWLEQQRKSYLSYINRCLQLLYWIYFKPFTLKKWFDTLEEAQKPRFEQQFCWLVTMIPPIIILLLGLVHLYSFLKPFHWMSWGIFVSFFVMGLWLPSLFRKTLLFFTLLVVGLAAIVVFIELDVHMYPVVIIGLFLGLLSAYGIWLSLKLESAFGVALGILIGVGGGVAFGMGWEMAFAVLIGVGGGLLVVLIGGNIEEVVGISLGVIAGMVFAVMLGIEAEIVVFVGTLWFLGFIRFYFWLLEWPWAYICYLCARRGNTVHWLSYLPYYFDEMIILPIPCMTTLIFHAYQEKEDIAVQTLTYLITSTNQQALVKRVITRITEDLLLRCRTTGEIAAIAKRLEWVPLPLPKSLEAVLPPLLDVSRGVQRLLETSSLSSRGKRLGKLVATLNEFRLLSYRSPKRERVTLQVIDHWINILDNARRVAEEQALREEPIPQKYVAGAALDPERTNELFKGRDDLFRELQTLVTLQPPPVLFLYGGRRTGKTSTLKYLPKKVGQELIPLLIDMQGAASATTLRGLATHMAKQIQEAALNARNIQLPPPELAAFTQEPFLALQEWFECLERFVPDKRFLLCLDEFERLDEMVKATGSRAPLNFLRYLLQYRKQWIVLFSGSNTPDGLAHYWSDYLISARTIKVSYLEEAEARDLIVHPSKQFPEIYEAKTVEYILRLTRCQPYLIQLLCFIIVEYLNRAKRRHATKSDVDEVLSRIFDEGAMYFHELLYRLTTVQQQVLRDIVQGKWGENREGREEAVRLLQQREIIERFEDRYRFQVPLHRMYIERIVEE